LRERERETKRGKRAAETFFLMVATLLSNISIEIYIPESSLDTSNIREIS